MRKLTRCKPSIPQGRLTGGSETSQYPKEDKSNRDSLSSGERNGKSLNHENFGSHGVAGRTTKLTLEDRRTQFESWAIEGDSPVFEI
jgi:hypothetical protein